MDDAADRTYTSRENLWDEQMPGNEDTSRHGGSESDIENEMSPEASAVGTSDPLTAVRDAEPYVPPMDPPVMPGGPEGIHIETGFGQSVEEEELSEDAPQGDQDILERALAILHGDSMLSTLDVHIRVRDGVIYLTGRVASVDDGEYAQSVLGELEGVVDVVDETEFDPTAQE